MRTVGIEHHGRNEHLQVFRRAVQADPIRSIAGGVHAPAEGVPVLSFGVVIRRAIGIRGRIGADGSARGLGVGGPPEVVADFVRAYAALGIEEVLWVFRNPFDLETIRRMPEVRALLTG